MQKNMKKTLFFCGAVTLSLSMMFLGALIPKDTRYQLTGTDTTVSEVRFKSLKKPGIKVQSNLTFVSIFFLLLSIPPAVLAYFIVAVRLPELELEAEEYAREKSIRKIRTQNALDTEREICHVNRTAAVSAHTNDIEKAYVELGKASKWLVKEAPEKRQIEPVQSQDVQTPANFPQGASVPQIEAGDVQKKTSLSDDPVDTFGVTEIASQPDLELGLLHPSETKARAILNQLALSRKSLLLIAGTGGGKSVTQVALISILKEKQPSAEFWVVSQKNDSFCGLKEKGRVTIFDINQVKKTLDTIHHVWSIYDKRRHLDEEKRKNLSPVRLLLSDWFSISLALEQLSRHPDVKDSNYLIELADIVLNGRDFNVCLWADLQSFNLDAIGMKADNNSRQNFNLIGLGNYYTTDEGVNDSYGVLSYMIESRHIISDKAVRDRLTAEFEKLRPISQQNERPIIFSTLEPASVCLQADVRHYQQRHQNTVVIELEKPEERRIIEQQSETKLDPESDIERLERIFNLEPELSENETVSRVPQNVKQPSDSSFIDSDTVYFTPMKLSRNQAIELIQKLKHEMKHNQTQIIWMLWNARPGKTKAYELALAEYKELTAE